MEKGLGIGRNVGNIILKSLVIVIGQKLVVHLVRLLSIISTCFFAKEMVFSVYWQTESERVPLSGVLTFWSCNLSVSFSSARNIMVSSTAALPTCCSLLLI
jgi:hypothetical protein